MPLHLQVDLSGNTTLPTGGKLRFANNTDTFFSTFKAGVNTFNIEYTLPVAAPTANQVLQVASVTGSGPYNVVLAWVTAGADKHYTQSFTTASTVTVVHNLSKFPAVTIYDSAGDEVVGDVKHDSSIQLTLTFSSAFSGTVTCN